MDLTAMAHQVGANVTPVSVIFFILFILSEVLGANPKIKTSSLYEVGKAILNAVKDQVVPKPVPVVEQAPVEPTATLPQA